MRRPAMRSATKVASTDTSVSMETSLSVRMSTSESAVLKTRIRSAALRRIHARETAQTVAASQLRTSTSILILLSISQSTLMSTMTSSHSHAAQLSQTSSVPSTTHATLALTLAMLFQETNAVVAALAPPTKVVSALLVTASTDTAHPTAA